MLKIDGESGIVRLIGGCSDLKGELEVINCDLIPIYEHEELKVMNNKIQDGKVSWKHKFGTSQDCKQEMGSGI